MSPMPADGRETGRGRGRGGGRQVDGEEEGPVPLAQGQASSAISAFSAPPSSPPPGAEHTATVCPPAPPGSGLPAEGEGDSGAPGAGDSKRRAADLCGAALSKVAELVRSDLRAASEEFKVLETANALTRDLYAEMNLMAQDAMVELSTLQKIFEDMAPNLALVDEVCGQVDKLYALVVGLDEHTKALETKFKKIAR